MRCFLCLCAAFLLAPVASAQPPQDAPVSPNSPLDQPPQAEVELELPDPTQESEKIQQQMEAVRGVEQLDQLRKEMQQLAEQNQQLTEALSEATRQLRQMQSEMEQVRADRREQSERLAAVPEFRLVAQVRTETVRRANIEAGGRVYRTSDQGNFRLQLDNGETVVATTHFLDNGVVEVTLESLDVTRQLSYSPTQSPDRAKP